MVELTPREIWLLTMYRNYYKTYNRIALLDHKRGIFSTVDSIKQEIYMAMNKLFLLQVDAIVDIIAKNKHVKFYSKYVPGLINGNANGSYVGA